MLKSNLKCSYRQQKVSKFHLISEVAFKSLFSIDTYCIGTHDSMFQGEKENNTSLANSCHLNTVLLILRSVP